MRRLQIGAGFEQSGHHSVGLRILGRSAPGGGDMPPEKGDPCILRALVCLFPRWQSWASGTPGGENPRGGGAGTDACISRGSGEWS